MGSKKIQNFRVCANCSQCRHVLISSTEDYLGYDTKKKLSCLLDLNMNVEMNDRTVCDSFAIKEKDSNELYHG